MAGGDLAQGFAIVGEIGDDGQDVPSFDKGQILRRSKGETWGKKPLGAGVGRQVEKKRGMAQSAALLKSAAKFFRRVVGYADTGNYGESLL